MEELNPRTFRLASTDPDDPDNPDEPIDPDRPKGDPTYMKANIKILKWRPGATSTVMA